ncbi:MAG: hypothetical protein JXO22_08110 [Phycisphaerae bacterium]|nr:hypothetical protein [Phycisphaerae bacterium]
MCTALLLLFAGTAASQDVPYDVVVTSDGSEMKVDIPVRPIPGDIGTYGLFERLDGKTVRLRIADIERIIYRESRQIELLEQLVTGEQFDRARELIVPLHFAQLDWPAHDDSVPWDRFQELRVLIDIGLARRHTRDGDVDAALEALDALRERDSVPPSVASELQAAIEDVFEWTITAALDNRDWQTAKKLAADLRARYPKSQIVYRVEHAISEEADRLVTAAESQVVAGQPGRALQSLEAALRLAPRDAAIQRTRARLLRDHACINCGLVGRMLHANPHSRYSYVDRTLGHLFYRSLFRRVPQGTESRHTTYIADLVDEWSVNSENTEVTLALSAAARWSDGRPILAADVAFTLQLLRDPDYPDFDERLDDILEDVVLLEDRARMRLRFRVQPPVLVDELCIGILPQHRLGQRLSEANAADFVVSGPYRPVALSGTVLTCTLNEQYADPAPAIQHLRIECFDSRTVAQQALIDGQIQLLAGLTQRDLDDLADIDSRLRNGRTQIQPLGFIALMNSHNRGVPESRAARLSLAAALELPSLREDLVGETADTGLFPSDSWAARSHRNAAPPSYAPDDARRRIADNAGLRERPLRFVYPKHGLATEVAPHLLADLQAAGLDVHDHGLDEADYRRRVYRARDYEVAYATYLFTDSSLNVSPLFRLRGGNPMDIRDDLLVILSQKQRLTVNRLLIRGYANQLEDFVLRQAYLLPLWHEGNAFAYTPALHGLQMRPNAVFDGIARWSIDVGDK